MFEVCCRLCLEQVPLQNIHSLYGKHKDFLIRDKIYELFQIRFSDTEKLSTVCNDCLGKIETVDAIRSFFLEADRKFKALLAESTCESKKNKVKNVETTSMEDEQANCPATSSVVEEEHIDNTQLVTSNDGSNEDERHITKSEEGTPCEDLIEPSTSKQDDIEVLHSEPESDNEPVAINDPCESDNFSVSGISAFDLNKLDHQPEPESLEDVNQDEYIVHPSGEIYNSDQNCALITMDHQDMSYIISDDESSEMRDLVEISESMSEDQAFNIVTLEYQCNVCNDIFENAVTFLQHTNTVHAGEYPHNCRNCYLIYKTKDDLIAHDCTAKPKIFGCSECSEKFHSLKNLRNHTRNIHGRSNIDIPQKINLFKCDFCDLTLSNNLQLLDHVQSLHPEDYVLHPCDLCERTFGNTQTLKAHLLAHERNYKCSFCDKLCPTAVSLAGHENTHTKDQPFQCVQCGRNFAQYTSMRRHMKIHFNEKAYQCDFCPKRFRQRTVMLTHRRIHTGEKPFSCETCGKSFRDHSTLAKHKKTHEKKASARKQ